MFDSNHGRLPGGSPAIVHTHCDSVDDELL